ncbi:MAG TPA: hypothetical protein VH413_15810 [Verrucomicrobiae bacterium]|jgi:hypothetical protein|nr:hypothetical protein [Verrucomicrobiae bacterium]
MNQNSFATFLVEGALALSLVTAGALALAVHEYQTLSAHAELDTQAEDRAIETLQFQRMLHSLNANHPDAVRQTLSFRIAANLANLRDHPGGASVRGMANHLTHRILDETRDHPEIYFAAEPAVRAEEIKAWFALDSFPLLTQTATAKNN